MIYFDVDVEPIDQAEDLWWVFHLKEVCTWSLYQELLHTLNYYNFRVISKQVNDAVDPDIFQALLKDELHNCFFTIFNSSEVPLFYLGMHSRDVLPPQSTTARLNADLFLELGKVCHRVLQPLYAFAENLNTFIIREDIEQHKLTHICWAQLFSESYVQEVGQKILLNAPGWRNENLGDGGLLYVLAASPYLYRGTKQYWQQARDYFAQYIISPIQWSDQP